MKIQSNRLQVEVAKPQEKDNITSRFDQAGFITSVVLDGQYEFCSREPGKIGNDCSGGVGLCSEVIADPLSEQVSVGESFPKAGVGLLEKKENQPYFFMNQYETEWFPISYEQKEDELHFHTDALPCEGYALKQDKWIRVQNNQLQMQYRMKNAGEKPIEFQEYCHNFLSLNGALVDQDYVLSLPQANLVPGKIALQDFAPMYARDSHTICFHGACEKSTMTVVEGKHLESVTGNALFRWQLSHASNHMQVQEQVSFQPEHFALWTIGSTISPEVFFHSCLQPGEETQWNRVWTFDHV